MSEHDDWGRFSKANIPEEEKQAAFRARRFAPGSDLDVQHRRAFG